MTTHDETACRPDCMMCKIGAYRPNIEDEPLILESLVVGMGIGLSFWASGWLIYAVGSLIARYDGGMFVLAALMGGGGILAVASRLYGRR